MSYEPPKISLIDCTEVRVLTYNPRKPPDILTASGRVGAARLTAMPRESPRRPRESPHEAVRGSPGLTGNSARCPVTACDSRTAPLRLFWDSLKLQCLNKIGQQIAVGIWVSYVTSCYIISCSVCPGSSIAWGGRGEWAGTMRFSIG